MTNTNDKLMVLANLTRGETMEIVDAAVSIGDSLAGMAGALEAGNDDGVRTRIDDIGDLALDIIRLAWGLRGDAIEAHDSLTACGSSQPAPCAQGGGSAEPQAAAEGGCMTGLAMEVRDLADSTLDDATAAAGCLETLLLAAKAGKADELDGHAADMRLALLGIFEGLGAIRREVSSKRGRVAP